MVNATENENDIRIRVTLLDQLSCVFTTNAVRSELDTVKFDVPWSGVLEAGGYLMEGRFLVKEVLLAPKRKNALIEITFPNGAIEIYRCTNPSEERWKGENGSAYIQKVLDERTDTQARLVFAGEDPVANDDIELDF